MKKNLVHLIGFGLLVLAMLLVRFSFYEPLDRSVSGHDTERYTILLDTPTFWSDLFTSNRQTTTTLIYKLLQPQDGYEVTNLSSPGDFVHPSLANQPGFGRITTAQSILSLFSWICLAFVVFRHLQNFLLKYLGASLVLLFAVVPQTVEWDYVMLTEPISVSLYVLLLALSIELVVRLVREQKTLSATTYFLFGSWFLLLVGWVFVRDTNAYLLLVILAAFGALMLWKPVRERLPWRSLLGAVAVLALLFIGANFSLQRSGRWVNPFFNNLITHILPSPEYTAFFKARGLPITDEVMALVGTSLSSLKYFEIDYLVAWVEGNGTRAYMEFILTHPGWAIQTVLDNSAAAFGESTQPFFARNPEVTPDSFFYFGRLMHPVDTSVASVAAVQIALFLIIATRCPASSYKALAGLFCVFFIGNLAMYGISILGDAGGIVRHAMGAVLPMRLSLWLLPPFILDVILSAENGVKRPHGRMPKKKRD